MSAGCTFSMLLLPARAARRLFSPLRGEKSAVQPSAARQLKTLRVFSAARRACGVAGH